MWKVAVEDTARLIVGEPGTVKISIASSAAGATECPKITNVVLEMPQHGHGSDYATSFLPTGSCRWKIEGITATMRGSWRLRLILEWGNTVAVADMSLAAQ
jgi:hypothetical protein